jgi:hypothetical protein
MIPGNAEPERAAAELQRPGRRAGDVTSDVDRAARVIYGLVEGIRVATDVTAAQVAPLRYAAYLTAGLLESYPAEDRAPAVIHRAIESLSGSASVADVANQLVDEMIEIEPASDQENEEYRKNALDGIPLALREPWWWRFVARPLPCALALLFLLLVLAGLAALPT